MSGQLRSHDEEGPARCVFCGDEAAGPCASCTKPVCGNCCVLTEGGVRQWAICLECGRTRGRSLTRAWGGLLGFVGMILGALAALVLLLWWLSTR